MTRREPHIRGGWLQTQHAVFVRDPALDEEAALSALGIADRARPLEPGEPTGTEGGLYTLRGDEWLHVMDGHRTPMRRHGIRQQVSAWARGGGIEVFWFDLQGPSVALAHYVGGGLARYYEEVWSQLDGLEHRVDVGEPLVGELDAEGRRRPTDARRIARRLGIRDVHRWAELRAFVAAHSGL